MSDMPTRQLQRALDDTTPPDKGAIVTVRGLDGKERRARIIGDAASIRFRWVALALEWLDDD